MFGSPSATEEGLPLQRTGSPYSYAMVTCRHRMWCSPAAPLKSADARVVPSCLFNRRYARAPGPSAGTTNPCALPAISRCSIRARLMTASTACGGKSLGLRRTEAPYIIKSDLNSLYFLKEVEGSLLVSGDIIEALLPPYFLRSHRLVLG